MGHVTLEIYATEKKGFVGQFGISFQTQICNERLGSFSPWSLRRVTFSGTRLRESVLSNDRTSG
jgi:hypothetical protein